MDFLPNYLPATLRALLLRASPDTLPVGRSRNDYEREVVLLGFEVGEGGRLEAVLLTPRAPDEFLFVVDRSGNAPTWHLLDAPTPGGQWSFTKYHDVIAELDRRHDAATQGVVKQEPEPALELEPLTTPAIGEVDHWGVGDRPQNWKPAITRPSR